jgi:DNA polymerase III subunit epsilon
MPFNAWLDRITRSPRWDQVVFWALDLETTGLKPESDRIISVGMVPIRAGVIRYGERYYQLVKPDGLDDLSTEGIRAHHILPAELASAPPIAVVLPEITRRLREGVLLVHFAHLDVQFLRGAYRRCGQTWSKPRIVDTVDLALRWHQRQQQWTPHPPPPRTALSEIRAALRLPEYTAHHSLIDALATAELFLALRQRLGTETLRAIQ